MRIIFVGGGTAGPVSPLLAVAKEIKNSHQQAQFLFIGGNSGPEKIMAEAAGIAFAAVYAGKLRRYFTFRNFFSPFLSAVGFIQSLKILRTFKPDCIVGAGSYIQVPVLWAAYFLKIPIVIHQQDVYPSLANKLCSLIASKITVSTENSLHDFMTSVGFFSKKFPDKIQFTGNPFRESLANETRENALHFFSLRSDLPVLLVFGGGTGAAGINSLVMHALPELTKIVQVLHVTGAGKMPKERTERYHPFEFITEMGKAYAAADIVASRAGMSTITELSNLKKVSIIIPMPNSHQEYNGLLLGERGAAVVLPQKSLDGEKFAQVVKKILYNGQLQKDLQKNIGSIMPKHSAAKIADIVVSLSVRRA